MTLITWTWIRINLLYWEMLGHVCWALSLAWVRTGYGAVFYSGHEITQAARRAKDTDPPPVTWLQKRFRQAGYVVDWQLKNTLGLAAAVVAELLVLAVRGVR